MKGTRAPWRSGGFQSWSKGKYKISLEHHVLPENRELLKKKKKKKANSSKMSSKSVVKVQGENTEVWTVKM